jgi:predicted transcriptional regulator
MKNERIRDVFLQKKNYLKDLKSKWKAKTLKKKLQERRDVTYSPL